MIIIKMIITFDQYKDIQEGSTKKRKQILPVGQHCYPQQVISVNCTRLDIQHET